MSEITILKPEDLNKFVGCWIDSFAVQTINNDPVFIIQMHHPVAEKKIRLVISPCVILTRATSGFLVEHGTPLLVSTQLKVHVEDIV